MKLKYYTLLIIYYFLFSSQSWAQDDGISLGTIEQFGGYQFTGGGAGEAGDAPFVLETFLSNIIGILTILAGLYFLVYFILGALNWITAGGDQQQLETARQKMTNAAIGLTIVVAAYSVIYIVGKVLGLDILNPAAIISSDLGPN